MAVRRAGKAVGGVAVALLETCLRACVLALFARTFVVQAFVIPTGSMEPNLRVGDHVLVNKFIYGNGDVDLPLALPQRRVRRGDVVVFRQPQQSAEVLIKRGIGLPGDQVQLAGKRLLINGAVVDEGGLVHHRDPQAYEPGLGLDPRLVARDNFGPYVVPAGEVFFLGDNRDNSNDSRFWGSVPLPQVKGRAVLIYWSVAGLPDSGSPARGLRVRWDRMFRVVR